MRLFSELLQSKLGLAGSSGIKEETVCSIPLPDVQPLANIDEETAAR